MEIKIKEPARKFQVGSNIKVTLKDCGSIKLNPDEQVTFFTNDGKEYDVTRKEWGYYATPSINGRLKKANFKTALVINKKKQIFIMLVEKDKIDIFLKYIKEDYQTVLCWLEIDENIDCLMKNYFHS